MAWSDAARKAALEARKMHSHAREQFRTRSPKFIDASTDPAHRKNIAHAIRHIRKHGAYSEITMYERVSDAAASTRLRNAMRQAHKATRIHKRK